MLLTRSSPIYSCCVEPGFDVGLVEPEEVSPLEVGDASFGDEAADVAVVDAEALGDGGQVEQRAAPVVGGVRHLDDLQVLVFTALGL